MSETANPAKVGLFVVGAVALALGAVLAFGSLKLFQTTEQFEIHFNQSLMGLNLGAPVIFQGVEVGTVVDVYAEYTTDDPPQIKTLVIVELVEGRVRRPDGVSGPQKPSQVISQLIETGLRAKLEVQSLVTGQLYVNMVMEPRASIDYRGDGRLPEIPSTDSDLEVVKDTLVNVVKEVRRMPLERIGDDMVAVLSGLAELARSQETRVSLEKLAATLDELPELVSSVDGKLDGAYDEYMSVMARVKGVLDGADRLLEDMGQLVEPGSELQYQLDATLRDVRRTLQRVGALADQMQAQPDSILFGRGQKKESP